MKSIVKIGATAFPVLLGLLIAAGAASAADLADLAGTWTAALTNRAGAAAPLVFHIKPDGTGSVDSPAQGVFGRKLARLTVEDNKVSFIVPKSNASYHGVLDDGMKAIDGEWMRNGNTLPLRLIRRESPPQP